ncbi:MAG: hypothetical protein K0Q65_450 [Clostridia bacterium]|jgi:regulator of replication initiation timing|nr:hypothetical protein [Clostridia bacterium]
MSEQEERELVVKIEAIMAENEALRLKNESLKKLISEQQNWKGIRESVIVPRLRERYGQGECCFSVMSNHIAQIVKNLVDAQKMTEINETNYEEAKEIAKKITETICGFEWRQLKRLQVEEWSKWDRKPQL